MGTDSVHGAHGAPLARLLARFGTKPATSTPSTAAPDPLTPPTGKAELLRAKPLDVAAVDVQAEPAALDMPPLSPWDLPPDLYERWEERVCIMHYEGGLPWPEAEREGLANVLRSADANTPTAAPKAAAVQGRLFGYGSENAHYRSGL